VTEQACAPEDVAPATPEQRTLWVADRFRGGGGLMSVPILLRLTGRLEVAALEAALRATVAHHESLRTVVEARRGVLTQVVQPMDAMKAEIERLAPADGRVSPARVEAEIRRLLQTDPDVRARPWRAALWQTGEREHVFALNVHHLVTDGWSNRVLRSAIGSSYSALTAGRPVVLPPVGLRYLDHARLLAAPDGGPGPAAAPDAAAREYWTRTMRGARFARLPGPDRERADTLFRARHPRPPAAHHSMDIPAATAARLREVGRGRQATLFVLLLGAFMHALAARTGQDDLAVGSVFANRARPSLHRTVGMFANLAVLRSRALDDPLRCAEELRRPVLAALGHQGTHHAMLPYGTGREAARGAVSDAVFHLLAQPPESADRPELFAGLGVEELAWPDGLASRFELELVLSPREGGFAGLFRFASDRLTPAWVAELQERFAAAVEVMAR
jgi:Condensation domain